MLYELPCFAYRVLRLYVTQCLKEAYSSPWTPNIMFPIKSKLKMDSPTTRFLETWLFPGKREQGIQFSIIAGRIWLNMTQSHVAIQDKFITFKSPSISHRHENQLFLH